MYCAETLAFFEVTVSVEKIYARVKRVLMKKSSHAEMDIEVNMSLDDYIKKATELNIFKSNNSRNVSKSDALRKIGVQEEEERQRKDQEEEENNDGSDDDVLMIEDEDTLERTIWQGPSSKIEKLSLQVNSDDHSQVNNKTGFDLRKKLTKPNTMRQPNFKSQNWRMMRPNVNFRRQPGMPPLVPASAALCAFQHGNNNNQQNNNCRRWNKKRRGRRNSTILHLNNDNFRETRFHLTIPTLPKLNGTKNTSQTPLNSGLFNIENNHNNNNNGGLNGISNFASNEIPNASNCSQTKNLQDLFGLGSHDLNTAMMPQIASKVLDMIRGVTQPLAHKPIYDMAVHKEISEIQRKPFIYKCGGAQVVSSDGPGLNNVNITPAATPMSMNYRFA